jgi:hypothetical protein
MPTGWRGDLLRIIRDQGLDGARKAMQSGAFLPGLVGAVVVPSLLTERTEEQGF